MDDQRSDQCGVERLKRRVLLKAALAGTAAGTVGLLRGSRDVSLALSSQPDASSPVALGLYLPDAVYRKAEYHALKREIGRKPDFLVWYEQWSNGPFGRDQQKILRQMDAWGLIPVMAWEPFDPKGNRIDQPDYQLANIVDGDFDAYIDGWADGLASYGRPIFLSFAHEMNGNWTPWGIGVNGNQLGDFGAAWRHVHSRFSLAGADNVRWLWVPNEEYAEVPSPASAFYPGDEYVDWLGMNGFNWGAAIQWKVCDCSGIWRSYEEIFGGTYDSLRAVADKPIMILETASTEVGGDKATWISDAFLTQLPTRFPGIRAVTWFNAYTTGYETTPDGEVIPTNDVDWPLTSSPAALEAFRQAVTDPYYQGSLVEAGTRTVKA